MVRRNHVCFSQYRFDSFRIKSHSSFEKQEKRERKRAISAVIGVILAIIGAVSFIGVFIPNLVSDGYYACLANQVDRLIDRLRPFACHYRSKEQRDKIQVAPHYGHFCGNLFCRFLCAHLSLIGD